MLQVPALGFDPEAREEVNKKKHKNKVCPLPSLLPTPQSRFYPFVVVAFGIIGQLEKLNANKAKKDTIATYCAGEQRALADILILFSYVYWDKAGGPIKRPTWPINGACTCTEWRGGLHTYNFLELPTWQLSPPYFSSFFSPKSSVAKVTQSLAKFGFRVLPKQPCNWEHLHPPHPHLPCQHKPSCEPSEWTNIL